MASPEGVRDQLGTPHFVPLRQLAVRQINHVQGERPSDQITATAVALVALSESIGVCPFDVVALAQRVMKDAEGPFTHQVQALRDYAKSELARR